MNGTMETSGSEDKDGYETPSGAAAATTTAVVTTTTTVPPKTAVTPPVATQATAALPPSNVPTKEFERQAAKLSWVEELRQNQARNRKAQSHIETQPPAVEKKPSPPLILPSKPSDGENVFSIMFLYNNMKCQNFTNIINEFLTIQGKKIQKYNAS